LRVAAYFPDQYLPDISERVTLYRRLSAAETSDELSILEEEIRDRFGEPPSEVTNLIRLMHLRINLKRLHVVRLSAGPKRTTLQFLPTTPISPEKLVALIQKASDRYALSPDQKLIVTMRDTSLTSLLEELEGLR
jgi:transcription-repair coupling factor (superfamily II helicase)